MPSTISIHKRRQAIQLATFIVGCLTFEEIIDVEDSKSYNKPGVDRETLDVAIRVIAKCLEGRLADEPYGVPFEY